MVTEELREAEWTRDGVWRSKSNIPSLKLTYPLKIGRAPKGNSSSNHQFLGAMLAWECNYIRSIYKADISWRSYNVTLLFFGLCEGDIMFIRILKAHDFHFAWGDFLNFERPFWGLAVARDLEYTWIYVFIYTKKDLEMSINCFQYRWDVRRVSYRFHGLHPSRRFGGKPRSRWRKSLRAWTRNAWSCWISLCTLRRWPFGKQKTWDCWIYWQQQCAQEPLYPPFQWNLHQAGIGVNKVLLREDDD